MELEKLMGNKVKDVSIKNEGYDVYSISEKGEERHIEVKSVKKGWDFSLTNNEYTAAMQYGDSYFICLLYESDDKLKVRYIQNPLKNAKFEKRIRQWEWVCRSFISTEREFEVK